MTVKIRHCYRCGPDGVMAYRNASEHVYDPRDLDANGKPPAWFLPQTSIILDPGEIEFDHNPTEAELDAAFPHRKKENR